MAAAAASGFLLICGDEPTKVLVGYTPKLGCWSGFGGKAEEGETPWQTAMRETYEELFGCSPPPSAWEKIQERAPMTVSGGYTAYRVHISEILSALPEESPYYCGTVPPRELGALIDDRVVDDGATEITKIRVWNAGDGFDNISDDLRFDLYAELSK
jgi:hypothetical protein